MRWQKSSVVAAPRLNPTMSMIVIAGRPGAAEVVVGFVDARQLAQPEHAAERPCRRQVEPGADAGDVEVVGVRVLAVGLGRSATTLVLCTADRHRPWRVPGAVERIECHVNTSSRHKG